MLKNYFTRLIATALFFIAGISATSAAIVLDTSSINSQAATASTSWSHPTGAGSNKLLIVTVVVNNNRSITSITHGASGLTLFGSASVNGMVASMYYLLAPATGNNTITVNLSGSANIRAGSATYFNVNQSVPLQDLATTATTSSNPAYTFTSDPGMAVILLAAQKQPIVNSTSMVFQAGTGMWNNLSTVSTLGSASLLYNMGHDDWALVAGLMNPIVGLPVTFGEIKANKNGDHGVDLNFDMYDVYNVKDIEVERSTDGKNFESLGKISIKPSNKYSFFDADAPCTELIYRIHLTDKMGLNTYSPVAMVNNNETSGAGISVFPNPCTDFINIYSSGTIASMKLYNSEGHIVAEMQPNTRVDMTRYSSGLYYLYILDKEGNMSKHKFLHY